MRRSEVEGRRMRTDWCEGTVSEWEERLQPIGAKTHMNTQTETHHGNYEILDAVVVFN